MKLFARFWMWVCGKRDVFQEWALIAPYRLHNWALRKQLKDEKNKSYRLLKAMGCYRGAWEVERESYHREDRIKLKCIARKKAEEAEEWLGDNNKMEGLCAESMEGLGNVYKR